MDAQKHAPLILRWQDRCAVADARNPSLDLGRRSDVGLCVPGEFVSRRHATIERRKQWYVLVDHSANGTFVQTEDEHVAFVRRGELRLWGEGWISLGQTLSDASAIRFRHE